MKVINLFAGPGSGKSTVAAGLFYQLKSGGVNVELVQEFAKILAWENNKELIGDQYYVSAKQNRGLERLRGRVKYAITDSPLPLALYYGRNFHLKSYDALLTELFDSYDNINFFINRKKSYNPSGRFQTYEEALEADKAIKEILQTKNWPFLEIDGDENAVHKILENI